MAALFGCRRGGRSGHGMSGDRLLYGVHDSLAKGNIHESGKGEAEVCDERREGKGF
jgi:hypothetical protein